jgi:hypothetical protein
MRIALGNLPRIGYCIGSHWFACVPLWYRLHVAGYAPRYTRELPPPDQSIGSRTNRLTRPLIDACAISTIDEPVRPRATVIYPR